VTAPEHDAQLYRLIFETANEGIWVVDANERTWLVNPKVTELLGFDEAEMLGRSPFAFMDEGDLEVAATHFERLRQGAAQQFDFQFRRKDGTTIRTAMSTSPLINEDGRYIGSLAMLTDLTERLEAEEALRHSERTLRTTFDNEPDCVKLVARDGSLLEMNAAGLAIIEADSLDQVRGASVLELVAPEHREAFKQLHERVFRGERCTLEFDVIGLKGTRRSMETTAAPLPDDSGKIIAHLAVTRDVTARRELEEQLRQSQKMESLGRIAGGVAHDFNNLLTAIIGYSEAIERRGGEAEADAQEILRAADRAGDLVRQLLAFSRRQILEQRVLDLNVVVRDAVQMLRRTLGEHIDVVAALDDDLRPVRADPGQLQQVVVNLAVNARDAMPAGGVLTLETRNVLLGDDAPVPAGAYVQLIVADTGAGMTEDVLEHAFEPFFTTKSAGEGTGLGLATVHGIISQSGGTVFVESKPELGTSFKVFLPASEEPVAVDEAPAPAHSPQREAYETVLLVEDEAVVRGLVREILERDGYTVVEAADPEQALAVSRDDVGIDLLVTDVVMPRMSGPEIARALSVVRGDLKVLYMSGYSDAVVVKQGLLEPGTAFIQKPFRAQELTDKVRTLLERQRPSPESGMPDAAERDSPDGFPSRI
jgi:two-component system cell cycle sensor histidine kinase/response regulator CckA